MGPSGEHECSRYLERWIFKADRFGVASVIYSLHYGQPMNMICDEVAQWILSLTTQCHALHYYNNAAAE